MSRESNNDKPVFETLRTDKVKSVFKYELSRIFRQKIFFVSLALLVPLKVIILFSGSGISDMSQPRFTTWVMETAVLGGFGFLAFILCVIVGHDSVAGEFESGHVKTLFTKPLSKSEFFLGKYLACSLLIILVSLLLTAVGSSGYLFFESQKLMVNLLPVFGAVIYASLPYLSFVFIVSALTRKSNASVVVLFIIFFAQRFIPSLSGILVNWPVKLMPSVVIHKLLTEAAGLQSAPQSGSLLFSVVFITIYIIVPLLIGLYYLNTSDIIS